MIRGAAEIGMNIMSGQADNHKLRPTPLPKASPYGLPLSLVCHCGSVVVLVGV